MSRGAKNKTVDYSAANYKSGKAFSQRSVSRNNKGHKTVKVPNHIPDDLLFDEKASNPGRLQRGDGDNDGVIYGTADRSAKPIMVDFGDAKSEIMVDTNGYDPQRLFDAQQKLPVAQSQFSRTRHSNNQAYSDALS